MYHRKCRYLKCRRFILYLFPYFAPASCISMASPSRAASRSFCSLISRSCSSSSFLPKWYTIAAPYESPSTLIDVRIRSLSKNVQNCVLLSLSVLKSHTNINLRLFDYISLVHFLSPKHCGICTEHDIIHQYCSYIIYIHIILLDDVLLLLNKKKIKSFCVVKISLYYFK